MTMEAWQKSFIQENQSVLSQNTLCHLSLLSLLQEQGVLSRSEISELNGVGRNSASELLYRLQTRKGAFSALIDPYKETKQTLYLRFLQQAHTLQSTIRDELSDDTKNEIGNKLVNFQGKNLKLSECCNHLLHLINGKFLKELERGNTPTLVNNHLPDQVEHYISRTLRSRSKLNSSVFQQDCDDVFLFEGIEEHQLRCLVAGAEMDVSGNQIYDLTVRFILLEYDEDFEIICKLASSPVHLIKYNDSVFKWVKSSGSVNSLQKHVDDDQDCFLEGELASMGNRINVIPDSPGMGKTVLLANIAHQILKTKPNMLIRFIVMKDFVQTLREYPINLEPIVSSIAEQSSEFECGREIVKHILQSEPCILMFDGFDEVLTNQVSTAKKILSTIVTLKSAKIFVTTRPHMREELENTLHVLGYTINPFTESDQENFLLRFWQIEGANMNENLKQFATSCVKTISSNMTDFERDIAGIPLQCRLLAECYTEQALRFSQIGASPVNFKPISQINSIFEMYEMHMKMRLEKVREHSILKRLVFSFLHGESQIEPIKNAHVYYALELLFREHAHKFRSLKTSSFISPNELCDLGILESTNLNDVRFVHRTFAEFFVAWFAVEMEMSEKGLSFLLNELLATKSREDFIITPLGKANIGPSFTFNNPVIAYFINGFTKMYAKNRSNQDQTHRISVLMDSAYYGQVSHIFIASAINDYQFVPLAVSLCFDSTQLDEKGDSDLFNLLLISAKYSRLAMIKSFCANRDLVNLKSPSKSDSFVITPLHVAVQRGHFHIVEYLARKYEPELKKFRYLVHFCLLGSQQEKKENLLHKVRIIEYLSKRNNLWINEKLSNGTVPLIQQNVHCELIKCLIECGADINALDQEQNTILHKITQNPVTPEFYHWLVASLNERKFIHFNQPNSSRRKVRPLHCALEKVELLKDTLKYFQLIGVDFNVEDEEKDSPLFYAIRGRRSVSLICALIELGTDWKKKNKMNKTVLHIAAEYGNLHAMKHFLETFNMNVNAKDKMGNTALHYAVMSCSREYELIQKFLVTCGADVNAKNGEFETTPFEKGIMYGEGLTLSTIKLMEKHGLSIRAKQASKALKYFLSNRKILSWGIDEGFLQVLEFLILKGGVIGDIPILPDSTEYTTIRKSDEMQMNIRAIIQAVEMSCLWVNAEAWEPLTEYEMEEIQNFFYKAVQTKNGSFEKVCILMIDSNQMSISLLRECLLLALQDGWKMFITPPTFTSQLLSSRQNFNTTGIKTNKQLITLSKIRNTITENLPVNEENETASHLQRNFHENFNIRKFGLIIAGLDSEITKWKGREASQGRIMFLFSGVNENVENCQVTTDSVTNAAGILDDTARCNALQTSNRNINHLSEFFERPLIARLLISLLLRTRDFSHKEQSL